MKMIKLAIPLGILLLVSGCKNDSQDILKSEPETNDSYSATFDSSTNTLNSDEVDEKVEEEKQVTPEEEIAKLISDMGYDDNNKYSLSYEDLNNDGIPEVFVTVLDDAYIYDYLYTYYDHSLINLAGTSGIAHDCFYNIEDTAYFGDCAYSSYYQYEDYYTIKDGQLMNVASIYISNMPESLDEGFVPNYKATVDDKEVTVDEFWNYLYTILPSDMVDSTKRMMMDGIFEENEE